MSKSDPRTSGALMPTTPPPNESEILRRLLQDVVDKATPFGEIDEPGGPFIANYLLPTGPIHRALAYLRDGAVPAIR